MPGAKVSIAFIGYYVDSFHIEGAHITENTSRSSMQGWKNLVIDGKVTNTINNRLRKWNSVKNVLQITGNGTPQFPLDDIYKITGSTTGSNSGGHNWASQIVPP